MRRTFSSFISPASPSRSDTDALVIEEVRRDTWPVMLLEIRRRADNGISLWMAKQNSDHIAGHESGDTHAQIGALRNDVDQPALRDQVDMQPRMATQELQDKGREDFSGTYREGVDTERA